MDHFARLNKTGPDKHFLFQFLTLHKSWDKIQPTEHIQLNQKIFFFTCEIKKTVTN